MLAALMLAAMLQPAAAVSVRESHAASALYASLNRERVREGLPPLQLDPGLSQAALEHVVDMAHNNYFEHTSPGGVTPWQRMHLHNIAFSYAGENLALAGSAVQADHALFRSAPHRANSLSPKFTRVGIAVMATREGELLFVEDFAG